MVIDLRSDTVTKPTAEMRRVMAAAEVGDDVLGDDPTVLALQDRFAAEMGKEAACFVPSGTMGNQTSIRSLTEPGDEVLAHAGSHIIHYETGAPAALCGVMVRPLAGPGGMFDAADIDEAVRPADAHYPRTRLVVVENTSNRGGGSVWPMDRVGRVLAAAARHGLRAHLDGARLWNASVALGVPCRDLARGFDTVTCCFSKGLGAPAGSAVAGDRESIRRVHRFRKMFGGAMRQAGILAAAALHAMEHHVARLAEDHANARTLARGLAGISGIAVDAGAVETNMVFFDLDESTGATAAALCASLDRAGVRMLPTAMRRVRAVCHLDVTAAMIPRAVDAVAQAVATARGH
ncbi:MAG: aminotransferase class I/II-fold pyridoxal phosphate-dependent enzyme [Phycisphaeraceae bacterium]|nr:MAG: aminotransferase class I/II-fold pyridoxal phosphate-dependent enzyme [Phycisphaeraceae bacterium]